MHRKHNWKDKEKSVIRNISILMCVFYFDKVNITSNSYTVFVFKRYLTTTCRITHICILLTLVYWIVTNLSSSSSGAPPAGNNSSINNISPPRAVTLSQDIPLHSMSMNIYLQVYESFSDLGEIRVWLRADFQSVSEC